jgi:polyhydroxybutyrate depolymerase
MRKSGLPEPVRLALLLFAAVASTATAMENTAPAASADAALVQTLRQEDAAGLTRSWLEYWPAGAPRGVVLLLHGNGGSAAALIGEAGQPAAYRRWLDIAARERLVVLVPDGVPGSAGLRGWNDCRGDAATNPQSDDARFLAGLIGAARSRAALAALPAWVVGTSNGGHMALRLAIEQPRLVSGVAAIAAAMPAHSECAAPRRPVNVLLMNGTADPILPFEGGLVSVGTAPRGTALSAEESLRLWARIAGAKGDAAVTHFADRDPQDGSSVTRRTFAGRAGTRAVLYRIDGGGHNEPSRSALRSADQRQNHDIEMADEVWGFFSGAAADARLVQSLARQRVLVAGATGRNGSAVVAALEAAGARPRLLTRDVARAAAKYGTDRDWVAGDVTDPASLAAALRGIDVVIDAVATTAMEGPNGTEAVDDQGMRNLVAAARRAHVRRIVAITGMLVASPPPKAPPIVARVLGAKRAGELALEASGLEYVILRPTGIQDRPGGIWGIQLAPSATYRPAEDELTMRVAPPAGDAAAQREPPPPVGTIARADLAEVVLVAAADAAARNRAFVVTQGGARAETPWRARLLEMPRD